MPRIEAPLSMEYVLLGLLEQQPGHGYDLHKRLSQIEPLAFIWSVKRSQLYAILDKLEQAGYIRPEIVAVESRPSQKRYSITPTGHSALQNWISAPVEHGRDMRQDFLARLYFAYQAGPNVVHELIAQQEAACVLWLHNMQQTLEGYSAEQVIDRALLEFRVSQTEAMLAWLRRQQQELQ